MKKSFLLAVIGLTLAASSASANQLIVVGDRVVSATHFGYAPEAAIEQAKSVAGERMQVVGHTLCANPWFSSTSESVDSVKYISLGRYQADVTRRDTISCYQSDVIHDGAQVIFADLIAYSQPATHWERQVEYGQTGVWHDPIW
jgi:hypothetical protein